jgi:hypothetical protein
MKTHQNTRPMTDNEPRETTIAYNDNHVIHQDLRETADSFEEC